MADAFSQILRVAVESTPSAIGGSFAARDGELVGAYSSRSADDWAFLTAHFGVMLRHLSSVFGTWHFGDAEHVMFEFEQIGVIVHPVMEGYFALIAVEQPAPLARALLSLRTAVVALREEMS